MQTPGWPSGPVTLVQGACGHVWRVDARGRTGAELLAFVATCLKIMRCGHCLRRRQQRRQAIARQRLREAQRQMARMRRLRMGRGGARRR